MLRGLGIFCDCVPVSCKHAENFDFHPGLTSFRSHVNGSSDQYAHLKIIRIKLIVSKTLFYRKLSINLKKSKYIIFTPRQRKQMLDLFVEINNHKLVRVISNHFSWCNSG